MELSSRELAENIVRILDKKKAGDIKLLNICDISVLADYFIIASGNSLTQTKALADEVQEKLEELFRKTQHKEGYESANWILLDYGDVVVHILHSDSRFFYNLERLWSDAKIIDIDTIVEEIQGGF